MNDVDLTEMFNWDLVTCKEMVSAIDVEAEAVLNKKLISEKKRDEIFEDLVDKRGMLMKRIETLEN